ncbi:GPI ethanolamine phosphate transferase 3-like [Papaver somniferum]|uniref:GPI ethanolamine phosphate transferase 3-like n=1 Tax=Papaver somniferum TaxID=3469 RepID=UPI000E7030F4|nr:GPI ethanolamine phosphate transferase 3-like [Papaver somniferum]
MEGFPPYILDDVDAMVRAAPEIEKGWNHDYSLLLHSFNSYIIIGTARTVDCFGMHNRRWCITRFGQLEVKTKNGIGVFTADPLPVTQWSLFAVCLFSSTGHWCAFDGLRYGAAFIGMSALILEFYAIYCYIYHYIAGLDAEYDSSLILDSFFKFDEFNLIRQAILLTIDAFGVSLILPILGLPLLVVLQYPYSQATGRTQGRGIFFVKLSQVFLMYGLITSITTMLTVICVTIQRRHLMVWGFFAPKFVFDAVGLLLTDVIICLISLYYFCRVEDGTKQIRISNSSSKKMSN